MVFCIYQRRFMHNLQLSRYYQFTKTIKLAFAPNLPAALLERGIILNLVGQLDSAVLDWSKVIDVAPNSSEAISAGKWIDKFALK